MVLNKLLNMLSKRENLFFHFDHSKVLEGLKNSDKEVNKDE